MSTQPLETAIQSTRGVLADVRRDQLGLPTPCASWTVADVINHVVASQYFFASAMRGERPSAERPDFAAGDFLAAFDEGSAASVDAFGSEGAMERTVHLPFGDMPGSVVVGLATTDTLTHGWDVARATGQPSDLASDVAAALLASLRTTLPPEVRGPDGQAPFGPEQQAPAGSNNADQLAAFLGRTV
jgi:uncharacterized protein (TIGR03086 family)